MADRRAISFILFLILLLYLSSQPQSYPVIISQPQADDAIAQQRLNLETLSSSHYGDLDVENGKWLNVTGLKEDHGYAWDLLPRVKHKVREQVSQVLARGGLLDNAHANLAEGGIDGIRVPAYRNATAWMSGQWIRSKHIEADAIPHANLSAIVSSSMYLSQTYRRNVTSAWGKVQLRLTEEDDFSVSDNNGSARHVKADLELTEVERTGKRWSIHLHGVHFEDTGRIILTTTSEKFAGIFALPHFALSQRDFNLSRLLLNMTINKLNEGHEAYPDSRLDLWSSAAAGDNDDSVAAPRCEFIVYLQQHVVQVAANRNFRDLGPSESLLLIEDELRFPTGALYHRPPQIAMSMTIFSPDCGFILESKGPPDYPAQEANHLRGPKIENFISTARSFVLAYFVIIMAQIYSYKRQMTDASTPSTRSRVSFWTIAMLTVADTLNIMILSIFGVFSSGTSLALLAGAFVSFVSVGFFGMNLMFNIWAAQAPERRERERQRVAANPGAIAPTTTPINAEILPLPVTARQAISLGATPVILPPDQDLDTLNNPPGSNATQDNGDNPSRQFASIYARFVLFTSAIMFLCLNATTWPTFYRSTYTNLLLFIYLSFWWPQIYRNVMRNCRKALRWDFLVVQSVLRLVPILYFYCVEDNFLFVENDWRAATVFAGWVWVQICVLVSQEMLGPRWFVRNTWVPPAYDYHRLIREDEEEATMPLGRRQSSASMSSSSSPTDKGKRLFDCAICKETIEVPVMPVDGRPTSGATGLSSNILARRAYMVTPCRHIFHTQCLEDWMRYRLVCPNCRETLPTN